MNWPSLVERNHSQTLVGRYSRVNPHEFVVVGALLIACLGWLALTGHCTCRFLFSSLRKNQYEAVNMIKHPRGTNARRRKATAIHLALVPPAVLTVSAGTCTFAALCVTTSFAVLGRRMPLGRQPRPLRSAWSPQCMSARLFCSNLFPFSP